METQKVKWCYTKDSVTGAEYISIGGSTTPRVHWTKVLRENLLIDFDVEGNIVGVEILDTTPKKL